LKRTLTDVLRRGMLSTLANWPVILTRVAESLVLFGAVVVAIIGCIVPLLVSAGIGSWELPATPQNAWEWMARIFAQHAALFAYLFLFILAIGLVMVVVHAFVSAGVTRIFVDAERAAPDTPELRREQFAAFTLERWSAGGRAAWLRLFWIYNGTWGLYGLILLVPTLLFALLIVEAVSAENTAAIVASTCGGIALVVGIGVLLAFVFAIWTQKAVVVCVARDVSAAEALRSGWREVRADFLRHFLVYLLITVVSAGASSVLSSAFAPFTFGARVNNIVALLTGPVQIASFAVQMAIGNAVASWLIACYAAMTEER
jgi:hypothetical protein